MNYRISYPSNELSGLVKYYWTMENCMSGTEEYTHRIVPSGLTDLTFYSGSIPESLDPEICISGRTTVTGLVNKYFDLKISQRLSLFSVIFQPAALAVLLQLHQSELFNQNILLGYLTRGSVGELEDRLFHAESFEKKIGIMEKFLMDLLRGNPKRDHLPRIHHSLNLIKNSGGQIEINRLASESCFGRKQFERVFAEYVGTSPKKFLRIVRFQNVIREKAFNADENLTSLGYKCGYFDQSHMTHDFVRLSGMTPKEYFRQCEPFSDYFQ